MRTMIASFVKCLRNRLGRNGSSSILFAAMIVVLASVTTDALAKSNIDRATSFSVSQRLCNEFSALLKQDLGVDLPQPKPASSSGDMQFASRTAQFLRPTLHKRIPFIDFYHVAFTAREGSIALYVYELPNASDAGSYAKGGITTGSLVTKAPHLYA